MNPDIEKSFELLSAAYKITEERKIDMDMVEYNQRKYRIINAPTEKITHEFNESLSALSALIKAQSYFDGMLQLHCVLFSQDEKEVMKMLEEVYS